MFLPKHENCFRIDPISTSGRGENTPQAALKNNHCRQQTEEVNKNKKCGIVKTCAQGSRTPSNPPPPSTSSRRRICYMYSSWEEVISKKVQLLHVDTLCILQQCIFTLVYTQGGDRLSEDAYEMLTQFIYLLFTQV